MRAFVGWLTLLILLAPGIASAQAPTADEPMRGSSQHAQYLAAFEQIKQGNYEAALPMLEQAEQALDKSARTTLLRAKILLARGNALGNLGRYIEANAVLHEVLALGTTPALRRSRRAALLDLAHNAARTGHFAEASRHFDAAVGLLDASDDQTERAEAQYAFAVTLAISGDHERAAAMAAKVVASEQAIKPQRRRNVFLALFLQGTELMNIGRPAQALPVFESAERNFADVMPSTHRIHALLANNHGNALLQLERLDEARAFYQRALDLHPDGGSPEHMFPLVGRATVALWQDDHAAALRDFDTVAPTMEAGFGVESGAAQFVRTGRVAALWANGKIDEAYALAASNEHHRQSMLEGIAPEFAERQALALKEYLQPDYEWVVALATVAPTPARVTEAWELLMAARGELTAEVARRRAAARASSDPALHTLWEHWRRSNEALATAVVATSADGNATASITNLRNESEAAERVLARRASALARARAESATRVQQLQHGLPDDAALVVYVHLRYGQPVAFDRHLNPQRFARRVAFVLVPGQPPRLVDLGPAAPIEAVARAWHRALRDPRLSVDMVDKHGVALRRLVLDPLALPSTAKKLFVLVDGALARVSLAALPSATQASADRAGARETRYLVETGVSVHYLEHERDVLAPMSDAGSVQRLVLVGAPAASTPAQTRSERVCIGGFAALPHALRELDAIDALWKDKRAPASRARFDGVRATKAAVLPALPGASILHFATHGLAFAGECVPDQRGAALAGMQGDNMLSALVLSGVRNQPASALLGAGEIGALDLAGTHWVVLSACETGLGREHEGEGVFGLRRAFRIAGADTVVMSLWSVQDAASATWMRKLYEARLLDNSSTIDAVAHAERSLLAQRRQAGQSVHPYYWAAFVSAGDWR